MLPSVLLTAAILLIPALLYAWGRQADAFAIERVSVGGERRIPEKQALRLLRREFEGRNLFTVTTADVHDALDRLCYLASVEVDRDFPTTLRVRLVEHRPLLYVLANERWFLVADSGHVICEVTAEEDAGGEAEAPEASPRPSTAAEPSPSVSATAAAADGGAQAATDASDADSAGDEGAGQAEGEAGEDATSAKAEITAAVAATLLGGPAKMDPVLPRMAASAPPKAGAAIRDADVRQGLRVLAALPASLRARVLVLRVDDEAQVSLDLHDGPLVKLGGVERMPAKVLSLRAVLAAYRRAGVDPTEIDVSAPDRPLARPRLSS
jgi:cell division septal protein FtsQ